MTTRALGDQFFKRNRKATIKMRYEECVAKADADGTVLFGLDERGCWRSDQAQPSYASLRFGSSEDCKTRGQYHMGLLKLETIFEIGKMKVLGRKTAIMRPVSHFWFNFDLFSAEIVRQSFKRSNRAKSKPF